MADMGKPVCGSEKDETPYDFPLHVAAVFIVFAASIGGAGFPVVAKKVRWMKIPASIFFFCKHFGTGVLIATAFAHLLPTAFFSLTDPCLPEFFNDQYPALAGVIMMAALFLLFCLEMWLNSKTGGHSHGSADGHEFAHSADSRPDSRDSQRTLGGQKITGNNDGWVQSYPSDSSPLGKTESNVKVVQHHVEERPSVDEDLEKAVDPLVLKKQSMQITLIEGGILFHSVFVGITISITSEGFIVLLIAILFHQMFEGLGLGSRIADVPYPRGSWKPWALVVAFGATAPIGQAIGLATRGFYDPNSALGLIMVGVFNAISSGLLIYASLVNLLAEDFLSEEANSTLTSKDKKLAFAYLLLGAIGMSVVGAFA